MLWTEKYKPKIINDIIGNKVQVNKIDKFLKNWKNTLKSKALLLSGFSGIGKTSSSYLLGLKYNYKIYELNTSDIRSKKKLNETISNLASHVGIFKRKILIILDEIDGMNGNRDYGGLAEVINIIKNTTFPIICICNDTQKLKTLINVTTHLKFKKPTLEQIKPYIQNISKEEDIQISSKTLDKLITYKNFDIRNIITTLQFLNNNGDGKKIKYDSTTKNIIKNEIDTKMKSSWDTVPLFFKKDLDMNQKLDLYFNDPFMNSILVYQNFLKFHTPIMKSINIVEQEEKQVVNFDKNFDNILDSYEYISDGDLIDKFIHSNQNYSLMPHHGILSTVAPGTLCSGGKGPRFLQGPTVLSNMKKSTSKKKFLTRIKMNIYSLDLLSLLLSKPLIDNGKDGIEYVIDRMNEFNIDIDDYKQIMEYYPKIKVETKIKSALTRTWNKMYKIKI